MQSGPVFDIKRFSIHDGPGIRTTVFLLGCPLSCWWCHNPESQGKVGFVHYSADRCIGCGTCVETCAEGALTDTGAGIDVDLSLCRRCGQCAEACPANAREVVGRTMSVAEVVAEVEKDEVFFDESGGGVTFSGGEPLRQPEFLLELLRACGDRGLHRAVDTTGLASPDVLMQIAGETDLFLYDLKVMDRERHRHTTGASNEQILANLERLVACGSEVRVRIPLVPGINDDDENIDRTAAHLQSLERVRYVSLLPFHRSAKDKHHRFNVPWRMNGNQEIPHGRVQEIASRIEGYGLNVRIGG